MGGHKYIYIKEGNKSSQLYLVIYSVLLVIF